MTFDLVRFGDYFSLEKGASYTSANLVEESDVGLLTINAFNVGGGYKPNSEKPFDGQVKDQYMLSEGDVLLAMTEQDSGLLASPLVVKMDNTEFKSLLYSLDVAKVLSINNEIETRFLFNVLRVPAFRARAAYGDTGSTVQRLPYEALYDLKIPKPPIRVQRAIVLLMDAVDEKIRTNHRLSSNLEKIAQVMFKSWFIDFDPVKAKMAGEKPVGMDDATSALFSDSMEESEMGLIPKSWRVAFLEDSVKISKSSINPQKFPSEKFLHYSIPAFDSGKNPILHSGAQIQSSKFVLNKSCLLVSKLNPANPRKWLISNPEKNSITSTEFVVLEPKSADFLYFLNCLVRSSHFQSSMVSRVTGSTGSHQRVRPEGLLEIPFVLPPNGLIQAFASVVTSMFEEVEVLQKSTNYLSEIRDALLPTLISGELEIPEEMFVK